LVTFLIQPPILRNIGDYMLSKLKDRLNKPSDESTNDVDFTMPKRTYYDLWGHTRKEFLSLKFSVLVLGGVSVITMVYLLTTVSDLNSKLQLRPVIAVPGAEALLMHLGVGL